MKSVLLVAFHFPPLRGSSGLQRPLALARYLPRHGWTPLVLTATRGAYESIDPSADRTLPEGLIVKRAFSLDASRHLAFRGRYPDWLALPDRWVSWLASAVPVGLGLILRHRPALIWSTYPLATAHLVGAVLHRLTGIPWVADFRDPMVEHIEGNWFPEDPRLRAARLFTERAVARSATAVTFCTATARKIFLDRHRGWNRPAQVIANGFDPDPFVAAEMAPTQRRQGEIRLVHSGTLYPGSDRDPGGLFRALSELRDRGELPPSLRVVLRASGFDSTYRPMIASLKLEQIVELAPAVGYTAALREMLDADGLVLFQGHTSNPAIPAKLYEYLRARRPILALVDANGETAGLLRQTGIGTMAPINDSARIVTALSEFLAEIASGTARHLDLDDADRFSRIHRVAEFATLFADLT